MALEQSRILAIVIIPHGILPTFRRNLLNLGFDGFSELMATVDQNLVKVLHRAKGAVPWVIVDQRRYPSRVKPALLNASLQYDLGTAFPTPGKGNNVKVQPQWLQATYDALAHKKSNLQVAVGAAFPYRTCPMTKEPEILDYIVGAWLACKPLVDTMLGKST